MGEEENQGKMYKVKGDNGGALPSPPHGEVPRDSPVIDHMGRRRERRFGDLCDVLSTDPGVCGIPGGRMYGKAKQPRETVGALNILKQEG